MYIFHLVYVESTDKFLFRHKHFSSSAVAFICVVIWHNEEEVVFFFVPYYHTDEGNFIAAETFVSWCLKRKFVSVLNILYEMTYPPWPHRTVLMHIFLRLVF